MVNGKWEIKKGRGLQHVLRRPSPIFYLKKRESKAFAPALYPVSSLPHSVWHPLHEFGTTFFGSFSNISKLTRGLMILKSWEWISPASAEEAVLTIWQEEHRLVPLVSGA